MMDETFDVFLNGMETNCQKAAISELLRSRTEQPRVDQPQKSHDLRVPGPGFTSKTEEKTKDLLERAHVCTNEAENLEQEHKADLSLLHDYTQKGSPLRAGTGELIEMSKNMYVCDLNVDIGATVFPEMIAKSRELNAEVRKRNQVARNAFDMTAFTMELQKIQDQQKKKTALIIERDAQMGLLEELNRDVEARQLEYDDANAETEKFLAQLEEINATIAAATVESENASSALAAGIQKMGALQKQAEQFEASEKERIDRETAAKSTLATAAAEYSKLEQQIQKAEAGHRQQTEQEEAMLLEMQQSLQNTKKVNDDELAATDTQLETLSAELSRAQQEIDRIAEVKKAGIEDQVANEAVSTEIADMEQQIGAMKEEIQKAESVMKAARLEKEAALAAKTTTVESAQKELAEKESGLAVDSKNELLEKSMELRIARDAMAKEVKLLNTGAFSAEAKFRREERKALNKSKEKETPSGKNNVSGRSKKAASRKAVASKSGQNLAAGDHAEVPAPRVEKKQPSQPKTLPIQKIVDADDSLYNGSDDDEDEDGDDDMDFNLSFVSDRPTNTQSSAAVPAKFADSTAVTEHSSITFDPSQFQTSTPIQKRARGRVPPQVPKKQAPQKLTATRRGRGKK